MVERPQGLSPIVQKSFGGPGILKQVRSPGSEMIGNADKMVPQHQSHFTIDATPNRNNQVLDPGRLSMSNPKYK
jgi:hypothetical protein